MVTERYYITFYDVDLDEFNLQTIEDIWREEAEKTLTKTGVYITTIFNFYRVICGYPELCSNWNDAIRFVVIRNPIAYEDAALFEKAFLDVFENVKSRFNNPHASLTKENIDYYYFTSI